MVKKYAGRLLMLVAFFAVTAQAHAALPSRSKRQEAPATTEALVSAQTATGEDDDAPGHSGHHGGGHHHSGGHYHGGHSHHSYHERGHYHHYAAHYHHYHHHYHVYHGGWFWGTDYAGASILCDIIFPLAIFGVLFGAIGMGIGRHRRLARAGLIIGIIEVLLEVALIAILL